MVYSWLLTSVIYVIGKPQILLIFRMRPELGNESLLSISNHYVTYLSISEMNERELSTGGMNDTDGKTEVVEENPVSLPHCPPQIPRGPVAKSLVCLVLRRHNTEMEEMTSFLY
jgi:hypothetical protein